MIGTIVRLPNIVFATNVALANALALGIAFTLDLPNPWWAMVSVFLVSQPFLGGVWGRATYRVIGTAVGMVASILIVPPLASYPPLLILAVAIWVGACLFVSLRYRSPRGYGIMLSGYTVALVGLPAANAPLALFDLASVRCEEIVIGAVCAAISHAVFFPRHASKAFFDRVSAIIEDARGWLVVALDPAGSTGMAATYGFAKQLVELTALADHVRFEGTVDDASLSQLDANLILLLPLASAVDDRLAALHGTPLPHPAATGLTRVRAWLADGSPLDQREAIGAMLLASCDALSASASWRDLLALSLIQRLGELVDAWTGCVAVAAVIEGRAGSRERTIARSHRNRTVRPLHLDSGLALRSAFTVGTLIVLLGAFTIAAGYPEGPLAMGLAAVACSLFSAVDQPAPIIRIFAWWSVPATAIAAFYVFVLLQAIDGYVLLIALLSPLVFLIGLFQATPAYQFQALAVALGLSVGLSLQPQFRPDFAGFMNVQFALVIGFGSSAIWVAITRSIAPTAMAHRIVRAGWRDLAGLCTRWRTPNRIDWVSVMIDRMGQLLPRLAGSAEQTDVIDEALRGLRIGVGVVDLRSARKSMTPATRGSIDGVLAALAPTFRQLGAGATAIPRDAVRDRLDATVDALRDIPDPDDRATALSAYIAVRSNLFPGAPRPGFAA